MNMAPHFNHHHKNCLLIATLICVQWKFTTPDQLASPLKFRWSFAHKRFFFVFDHWSIHLFQNKQRFQAIEFMDQPIPEKPDIFWIHTCCASDCDIYHQFPRSPLGMPGTMIPLLVGTQKKGKGNTESRCLSKLTNNYLPQISKGSFLQVKLWVLQNK